VKKILLTEKITVGKPHRSTDGEPIPLTKKADDTVIAGTINGNKSFVMIAEKLVQKPCFRKLCKWLIQPVAPEHDTKIADRIAKYFVPIVVAVS
jgi:Cu2+-exporting ATPase